MEKLGPEDPQRIGGYRLLARLGAGGMGQVYLARSDRGRTVAVKLVRRELAAREEFRARFRQEVRNAQRVGGFWTAPVLDADTEAAVPWVATGYVAGPSLQQVVSHDHGPLPERSVRILAAGLAHALANIHAAGIVHRDLKPSNVMVTIEGPRVIDFGVARALESVTGDSRLTQTGAVIGSPGFMAPEQLRGDAVTPASDVFCLGSVITYAATGTLPFGSADSGAHALMFRIAEDEPDLSGVPEGIADLVRACLRKDPAARPSLDRVLELTGVDDTVSDGRSRDPWLPGALVAQLGRHAVRLLEVEDPEGVSSHSGHPTRPALPHHSAAASEAFPEHSGPRGGAPSPDPRPTRVAGADGIPRQPLPPGGPAAPPHPVYGYPQQHPQPAAYGHPHQPPAAWSAAPGRAAPYNPYADGPAGPGATPAHDPYGPADPAGPQEPPRRKGRTTALLVAVALIVAIAAGGSVYAFMNGDGDATADPAPTASGGSTPSSAKASELPSPDSSTSPSASPSPSSTDGVVPAAYLGTWTTTIENESGTNTRRLTLAQGKVGDAVLALVADGEGYHCEFSATLSERPGGEGPLRIGPSKVTAGEPLSSCSPGAASEITLLADGALRRVNTGTGEKLTYTRR
ncbi:serine/threonine-protein kinase [Streptomyces rishiriensis]|uniref:Serine/threonine protein kinase n=1 Tax=Streptomyces rishiriensis TaxID=68264 RepID=A0ABU0NUR9_STRRH|nr:serine/threonine-protein kinase [Streptomyces rishiriensis]MDQ0582458.1 serine/threonine protein kinase [Streptomyces rishiriensis]